MYSQTHLIPLCLLEGAQNPSPKISCGLQTKEKEEFTPQSRECKSSSGKERFNKSAAPVIRMIKAYLLGGGNIRWRCKHIVALVQKSIKKGPKSITNSLWNPLGVRKRSITGSNSFEPTILEPNLVQNL